MSPVTRTRTLTAALTAVALSATVALTSSTAPAHAAVSDATCTGSETATYTPGLTLAQRDTVVAVHYLFSACLGTDASVTSGAADRSVTSTLSCDTPETSGPGSMTIVWSNGDTSGYTFNRIVSHLGGQTVVTFTGQIVNGEFAGDAATLVSTVPSLNVLDCLSPSGLTSATGVDTLDITTL